MKEVSVVYKIPLEKTASRMLSVYIASQNSYTLEKLKDVYEYEVSRNDSPEIKRILEAINAEIEKRKNNI